MFGSRCARTGHLHTRVRVHCNRVRACIAVPETVDKAALAQRLASAFPDGQCLLVEQGDHVRDPSPPGSTCVCVCQSTMWSTMCPLCVSARVLVACLCDGVLLLLLNATALTTSHGDRR